LKTAALVSRRLFAALAATVALAPTVSRRAFAQPWPTRPVHIVVPYAPGGSTDTVARITGDQLSTIWGQQAVIENKPGAGTNIGAAAVASSDPDGYTMLIGTSSLATTRLLYRALPYAISDLAPVTLVCTFPLLMVVPNSSPAKSVSDFIAFAREKKGKVTFASPGVGTVPHLAGELLKQITGIEMTHVPYRGDRRNTKLVSPPRWKPASGPLRADERKLVADSTTDRCRRENCAGNHEGKRHADKNKNKAIFGMLAISSFVPGLMDVRSVEQ
jgi:tripartite-type tricarboxylate transporter receptor subunit TctC